MKEKMFHTSITHHYLCKATDKQDAIHKAMDRFMDRKYGNVYFDGVIVNAEITDKAPKVFDVYSPVELTKKGVTHEPVINIIRTQRNDRNREDTEKSDYLDFSTADVL
jgi:hypothetical protein